MNINEWLWDDINNLKQKIRFKDRIEYRVNGKLHNSTGPALITFGDVVKKTVDVETFYIKGIEIPHDEWEIMVRPTKLKKIMKNIKKKRND